MYAQWLQRQQGYIGPFETFLTPTLHEEYDNKTVEDKRYWKKKGQQMKAHPFWSRFISLESLLKKGGPHTPEVSASLLRARVKLLNFLLEEVVVGVTQ